MKNEEKTPIGTTMVYFVRGDWKSSENKAIIQPFSLVCYYLISRIMWREKKETFGSEMALLAELAHNSQTFSMLYVFFFSFSHHYPIWMNHVGYYTICSNSVTPKSCLHEIRMKIVVNENYLGIFSQQFSNWLSKMMLSKPRCMRIYSFSIPREKFYRKWCTLILNGKRECYSRSECVFIVNVENENELKMLYLIIRSYVCSVLALIHLKCYANISICIVCLSLLSSLLLSLSSKLCKLREACIIFGLCKQQ